MKHEDLVKKDFEESISKKIKERCSDDIIELNGRKFVEIELFLGAIREAMFNEALIGAYIKKNGSIKITEDDILSYLCEDYNFSELKYNNKDECSLMVRT